MRITEGESVSTEKGFNAEVIRFNNTQNIIKSSDFRSNDSIQLWLERKFQELRPTGAMGRRIAYARKRSYRRPQNAEVLRLEDLAKIRFTWLEEPTRAVADPKSLWAFQADGGVYETAFGIDGTQTDFWSEPIFRTCLIAVIAYFRIEQQVQETVKRDRQKFLFLRRLRFYALALFAMYCNIRGLTVEELLKSKAKFEEIFSDFWKDALRELISAHIDAQRDKITAFALARNDARWANIKEKFTAYVSATLDGVS